MLTPVPMVRVEVIVLDRDLVALSRRIGALAVLHPLEVRQLGPWAESMTWAEMDELAARYGSVGRRLDRVAEFLGLSEPEIPASVQIAPGEVLHRASGLLEQVEPEVRGLERRLRDLQAWSSRLVVIEGQLEMLSDIGVDLSELRSLRFLHLVSGLVPTANVPRLEDSLRDIPHVLIRTHEVDGRTLLFGFSRSQEAPVLDRALESAYVERIEIPPDLLGTPAEALAGLRQMRIELEGEFQEAERNRQGLLDRWGEELRGTLAAVEANARVVEVWRGTGRTERTRLLAGWVPEGNLDRLAAETVAATDGRAVLSTVEPTPSGEPGGVVPTALSNPRLLQPFEELTRTYGLPDYWDLDPTPLAAGLFVLMFGAMFGDLGQGAVLAALGLALARGWIWQGMGRFGRILAACGISAMVFGLLYGSVFGTEELIPALWLRPMDNPGLLIGLAVAFGGVVLTVGLILGAVGAWRRRDRAALYLGQNGLVGLWLYWGLVVSALLAVLAPGRLPPVALVPLVSIPVLILLLHGPISRVLGWGEGEEGGAYFIQAGVETFDLVVRFASNTLSFLRLGAFALAHAGLGLTVFALAEVVHGFPGASLAILVLGNGLILALEGLIVGIQALRLEYYEFFTKFLRGGGTAYRPFALHGDRGRSRRAERGG